MSDRNLKFEPTYENAKLAQENGTLNEWVNSLLISEGSNSLAQSLAKESPIAIKMIEFPLSQLKRIEGPEEKIEHRQSPDIWEASVQVLAAKIKDGFRPAPLIVTDYWNYFELADGNHRQEAMLRVGIKSYWTIFFIKHQKGKEYLESILKN